jgi:hypothetical protein
MRSNANELTHSILHSKYLNFALLHRLLAAIPLAKHATKSGLAPRYPNEQESNAEASLVSEQARGRRQISSKHVKARQSLTAKRVRPRLASAESHTYLYLGSNIPHPV